MLHQEVLASNNQQPWKKQNFFGSSAVSTGNSSAQLIARGNLFHLTKAEMVINKHPLQQHSTSKVLCKYSILQVQYTTSAVHYRYSTLPVQYTTGTVHYRYSTQPVQYTTGTVHYRYSTLPVQYTTGTVHYQYSTLLYLP